MSGSISAVCNFFNEPHALPGFLESASQFFDEIVMVHSPPSSAPPDDESIAIVEKFGARLVHTTIDRGYGVVRTRCIREAKCEFLMLLDADERFFPTVPELRCEGHEKYPESKNPNLKVTVGPKYNQGELLKKHLSNLGDSWALRLSRRHWFGAPGDFTRPCQNWHEIPDWQLRCMKASQYLFYDPNRRIHEHLKLSTTFEEPKWDTGDTVRGPFYSHFHCHFKPLNPEKNAQDMATYQALDKGLTVGMWLEEAAGVK